jgi:inward rectifier potassium channel
MMKFNTKIKFSQDTGFSTNGTAASGRFINKDGTPNIKRVGLPFSEQFSPYHTLIAMPSWRFLLVIVGFYIVINLFFAAIYYAIGVEHLVGMKSGSALHNFGEAFFFSAQTFTTVGYGRISPDSFSTSAIAAFEAMIGLLTFAIATGLFYARFSQPRAFLQFSKQAIIAPFHELTALMFRISPYKNNNLTEAEVKVTAGIKIQEGDQTRTRYYPLELEISKVNALTFSWTLVHPINDKSPLFGLNEAEIAALDMEIIVFVKAFDDAFSNTVVARSSYLTNEIKYGARFEPMFFPNPDAQGMILDLSKIDRISEVDLSVKAKPE